MLCKAFFFEKGSKSFTNLAKTITFGLWAPPGLAGRVPKSIMISGKIKVAPIAPKTALPATAADMWKFGIWFSHNLSGSQAAI